MSEEQTTTVDPQSYWESQAEELKAGGGDRFIFCKEDKTRVRLLGLGHPSTFSAKVQNFYNGKASDKFLVLAYVPSDAESEGGLKLKALVATKGTWRDIVGLQVEGWDLFSEEGRGISITRINNGGRISYQVIASPRAVPIPDEIMEQLKESSLSDFVADFNKMQDEKNKPEENAQEAAYPVTAQDITQQIVTSGAPAQEDGGW